MKEATGPVYHLQGTVAMGSPDDPNACVGPDFLVYGINNLRVADLSIAPTIVKYVVPLLPLVNGSDPSVVGPSADLTCLATTRKARLIWSVIRRQKRLLKGGVFETCGSLFPLVLAKMDCVSVEQRRDREWCWACSPIYWWLCSEQRGSREHSALHCPKNALARRTHIMVPSQSIQVKKSPPKTTPRPIPKTCKVPCPRPTSGHSHLPPPQTCPIRSRILSPLHIIDTVKVPFTVCSRLCFFEFLFRPGWCRVLYLHAVKARTILSIGRIGSSRLSAGGMQILVCYVLSRHTQFNAPPLPQAPPPLPTLRRNFVVQNLENWVRS